ncbi:MAG: hypothetical protein JNN07_10225 [Verrucomicrobiales bacterium]|nr:hypothetical protein [Verrucomicrobiales bacterium]
MALALSESAAWFRAHTLLGPLLTALAVIPISIVMGAVATFLGAIALGVYVEVIKR